MPRLLLGVSGGIASYKALEFVRLATGAGYSVRVIQTPTAQRFVGAASFSALTGAPVLSDEFERDPARGAFPGQDLPQHDPLSHLEIVRNAEVFLIAPASANTIAKLAHGQGDNLLTTAALAATCPVLVAPAMNNNMYVHPATQANIATLRARGVTVLEPASGRLGSPGEWGVGRLPEPAQLLEACEKIVRPDRSWEGVKVLISAGGTREPIDSVRYVGNRSSGRMGFALADAAQARGAEVMVVAANVALERNPQVRYHDVETALQLQQACEESFDGCDVLIMVAAVADFRPATAVDEKLSKTGRESLTLELESTPDVLATLSARRRPEQTIVGFAAEHGDGAIVRARDKLARKSLHAIVVNDISRSGIGFDTPENEITIVTGAGEVHVPRAAKSHVADAVLDAVAEIRASDPSLRGGGGILG